MSSNNAENKNGIIILGVNIHCEGCANEVRKCLRGFEGVEGVEIDGENNKVSVKGKMGDPIKVRDWVRHKIKWKHVELISPIPPKPKQDKKEEEDKKPEAKVIEVVLKINMHCESCVKEVKHCILKMEGVEKVDPPNMEKNEVCVKGKMNPEKLVAFINKTSGRHAKIVKVVELNNNNNKSGKPAKPAVKQTATITTNNKGNGNKDINNNVGEDQLRLVYAPQLFSDENPNSCSVL